jgi:hypothetical protein
MQHQSIMWARLFLFTFVLFLGVGCREKPLPEESAPEITQADNQVVEEKPPAFRPPDKLLPVKPWSQPQRLKIYFEREPLAQDLLDRGGFLGSLEVEQVKWLRGENGPVPLDGDLYIISPLSVGRLRSTQTWKNPKELVDFSRIKPLFTGHSFDPRNEVSLPWRWSPYVFYYKKNSVEEKSRVFTFSGWQTEPQMRWPSDWALLWAFHRHYQKGSANRLVKETEAKDFEEFKKRLQEHVLAEAECWQALLEGKIQQTLALAAWKMRKDFVEDPLLDWSIPAQGTLIQFDHIMIPAQSPHLEVVSKLVASLLEAEGQMKMSQQSGYLPVLLQTKAQMAEMKSKLPSGPWLDQSEFLTVDFQAGPSEKTQPVEEEKMTPEIVPLEP